MSMKIKVTEGISLAGSIHRANEDTFGSNTTCAFVIDGATGLGDTQQLEAEGSDAAWLASFAKQYLEENLQQQSSPHSVFTELSRKAHESFFWPCC